MNSHEVFIHIHQGCFAGTGAIVRLPQRQWSKPDGYGKISQCITTTKHSKAKTLCIFLGIYCICWCSIIDITLFLVLNDLCMLPTADALAWNSYGNRWRCMLWYSVKYISITLGLGKNMNSTNRNMTLSRSNDTTTNHSISHRYVNNMFSLYHFWNTLYLLCSL